MSDVIDQANDQVERADAMGVELARRAAAQIPAGEAGECAECGLHSKRLVNGWCAPCRDNFNRRNSKGLHK